MAQVPARSAVVLRPSATLPLERVLQQLGEHLPRASRLRISLSGALCPAFDFAVPQGVRRWQERHTIARSWVAQGLALSEQDVLCELDATTSNLGAAMNAATLTELQGWARAQGHRIISVQPLWAQATHSGISRQAQVRALLVQEPDATTVLVQADTGGVQAWSLAGEPNAPVTQTRLAQLQVSLNVLPEHTVRLGFDAEPRACLAQGPLAWAAHWYTP